MYYECVICLSLNSVRRHSCQCCGTIPARYSILKAPCRLINHDGVYTFIETVTAFGCVHAQKHHAAKVFLQTVELTHFASE